MSTARPQKDRAFEARQLGGRRSGGFSLISTSRTSRGADRDAVSLLARGQRPELGGILAVHRTCTDPRLRGRGAGKTTQDE